MAYHNEIGQLGEQLAANFLRANGYTILQRNWRINRVEIDLIAETEDGTLVFVEVKTRSNPSSGAPEASVTPRKKQLLAVAASAYMQQTEAEWAFRFDIISVVMELGKPPVVAHFEDAFFPGLFGEQ
ncbi:MAG: YraN family protein [Bacteroidota bacterium]